MKIIAECLHLVYEQYSAAIRKEYVHIDEALYCQKRKQVSMSTVLANTDLYYYCQVLQEILRSPKIFSTKYFFNLYEEAARTNIQAEIEILENVTTSRC